MAAPWHEGPYKVVVEFLKSSSSGAKRTIQLKHSAAAVPPQLQGRIPPNVWQAFMTDIEQVGCVQANRTGHAPEVSAVTAAVVVELVTDTKQEGRYRGRQPHNLANGWF
jgi:hypothetical protein